MGVVKILDFPPPGTLDGGRRAETLKTLRTAY